MTEPERSTAKVEGCLVAASSSDEEFRIVGGGKAIGNLPFAQMLNVGQRTLFGGRAWFVEEIDSSRKTIDVAATKGGRRSTGVQWCRGRVHIKVRSKGMREIYRSDFPLPHLDEMQRFVDEGRLSYANLPLDDRYLVDKRPRPFYDVVGR